jgi:hypothetical protein
MGYFSLSFRIEISERSAKFILMFYLGKSSAQTSMASPGKGIQHRKNPQQDFIINLLKKCWGILQSVAHVIFNAKFYYSYDIV